jgi:hypothetical protein
MRCSYDVTAYNNHSSYDVTRRVPRWGWAQFLRPRPTMTDSAVPKSNFKRTYLRCGPFAPSYGTVTSNERTYVVGSPRRTVIDSYYESVRDYVYFEMRRGCYATYQGHYGTLHVFFWWTTLLLSPSSTWPAKNLRFLGGESSIMAITSSS